MTHDPHDLLADLRARAPHETRFHQAVEEVLPAIVPVLEARPEFREERVLERLLEPDRVLRFRVTWEDDEGEVHVQRGWRVQHTRALGPYKGGLRFHRSVDLDTLRFLAFEQAFKNALTGLNLGAGKGGSDFDPRGRSRREVMRFCHGFMTCLWRDVGPETDVPAGDIGVGTREVDFLVGQYRRLERQWNGALSGKSKAMGGIPLREEATGYGAVLFAARMLEHAGRDGLEGRRVAVSGAGNVALHAAERLMKGGARVVTLSDSGGVLRIPDGLEAKELERIRRIKLEERGSLADAADGQEGLRFEEDGTPWDEDDVSLAFPCATQNELEGEHAAGLVERGLDALVEGANMPCTPEAVAAFREAGVLFAPGKAANAGGVAMSEAEMSQNAGRERWSRDRAEGFLEDVMDGIHRRCLAALEGSGEEDAPDYVRGANAAAFERLGEALLAEGLG